MSTLLAQITDLHIREPGQLAYGRLDTAPYLRAAMRTLGELRQRPHAVVLTGDLVDKGSAAEYRHLAELIAPAAELGLPVYLMPGNHDDRDQLRRAFPGHGYLGEDEFLQYTVDIGAPGGLCLVALDTVDAGASWGRLCAKRLQWLETTLGALRGRAVVVAMHHPPFETLIGHMDEIGLVQGAGELSEILAAHARAQGVVERVVCGHLHRSIFTAFAGTVASTAPSPAHQVCLDLAPDAASAWTLEPPGLQIHAWPGRGRLVTHVAAIGSFDGPHPFYDPRDRATPAGMVA
jgi:3',5'-cyclic AMP phosphodiesterase CpdA